MARREVRQDMVAGAVRLLATKGLEGTSFGEVLTATGAPRGSTYHHFPGGKAELVAAALDLAGNRAREAMESVRGQPAPVVVATFMGLWRGLLELSGMRAGCAVLAVTVAADEPALLTRAGQVFRGWRDHLASLLVDGGLAEPAARHLATLTISAAEGAVVLARAEADWEPFDLVETYLVQEAERVAPVPAPDAPTPGGG